MTTMTNERRPAGAPPAGVAPAAMLATVQRVEAPRTSPALAWGTSDGRTILFRIDEAIGRELQHAIDAGEEPAAIVDPEQIVATDLGVLR